MGENSDEAAIRAQIEAWAAAVRGRDMAGILNHAADMIMFDVPPPLQLRGIAAYEESWPQFYDASPKPIKFDIVDLEITAGTGRGVCRGADALRGDGRRKPRSRFSPDGWTAQGRGTVARNSRTPLHSRNVLIT